MIMILYIENPKDSTQQIFELINEFSQVAEYKILEKEYKKKKTFKVAPPQIKYLCINLMKGVKNLHAENYRTLIKEVKEGSKKWKDSPCSWIGRINIVKMTILPKAVDGLM